MVTGPRVGERRRAGRSVAVLEAAVARGRTGPLAGELAARGWVVRCRGSGAGEAPALVVAGGRGTELDEALSRARDADTCLAVVLESDAAVQAEHAAQVTPFVYAADVGPPALATLVTLAADAWGRGRRRPPPPPSPPLPLLEIDLGLSIELDGVPLRMGVAERNFVYLLARERGAVVPKHAEIPGEGTRTTSAADCRRNLGKRVGAELASALVPERRNEPYQMRTPEELLALGLLRLRIRGRSSVRTISMEDPDRFPED